MVERGRRCGLGPGGVANFSPVFPPPPAETGGFWAGRDICKTAVPRGRGRRPPVVSYRATSGTDDRGGRLPMTSMRDGGLMTGHTVTHYRVGEKLGEGGSAVVYRAEDLALGREVVIKFFSGDGAGSVARFQHEARTISSLNHPNICTIYEIGAHEGRHFLAMAMLDGQVL